MRARRLTVLSSINGEGEGEREADGVTTPAVGKAASLGVLSVHFEGGRCRVRCPFCYLGQRSGADDDAAAGIDVGFVEDSLATLDYRELAVTLSEPVEPVLGPLGRFVAAAGRRGRLAAITTTLAVAESLPAEALAGVGRLNLSVDPWKGRGASAVENRRDRVEVGEVRRVLQAVASRSSAERVLIVTLSTPHFAEELLREDDGLLAALLAAPEVDRVALNALKPPPAWCDRQFWLRAMARLGPLLRQHLDRRLFLDCYVAARILGLGPCPARPDLSPAAIGGPGAGRIAFRSCVYQPAPDFTVDAPDELARRLHNFTVPAACPFPIR